MDMLRSLLPIALIVCLVHEAAAQQGRVDVSDTFASISSLQDAGHQAFVNQQWSRAIQNYQRYLALSPVTATHKEVTRRLKQAQRLQRQRAPMQAVLLLYPDGYGLGAVDLSVWGSSMYVSAQWDREWGQVTVSEVDESIAESLGEQQEVIILDDRNFAGARDLRYTLDDANPAYEYQHIMGTLGYTRKLVYPVWLNAGITAGYQKRYQRVAVAERARVLDEVEWVDREAKYRLDDGLLPFALGGEAGLTLMLGPLSAHGGMTYIFGREVGYYLGIGLGAPG